MSHEVRTPLSGVIGMLQLLRETNLDEVQQDYVQTISSSAELLLTIVNDILDFSRVESGRLVLETKPFNLGQLLTGLEKMTKSLASQKHVTFLTEFARVKEDDVFVVGDAGRIHQILSVQCLRPKRCKKCADSFSLPELTQQCRQIHRSWWQNYIQLFCNRV